LTKNTQIVSPRVLRALCALVILFAVAPAGTTVAAAKQKASHQRASAKHRHQRAHAAIINGTVAPGPGPLAFVTNGVGQCSGSVVSVNVVLTAAHCVLDSATGQLLDPSNFVVQTGAVTTGAPTATYSYVSRIVPYAGYQPASEYGDLALLQLASSIPAPAMPLAGSSDLGLLTAGTGAVAEGWGIYIPGSDQGSPDLRSGGLVVQSPAYCSQHAQQIGVPFNSAVTLCAIDPQGVTSGCHGDSGGPFVAQRPDRSIAQIGITSYGDPACSTSQPGFFTRIDTFSGWIKSWVTALAPPPPPAPPPPAPAPPAPATPVAIPPATPSAGTPTRFGAYTAHHGYLNAAVTGDGLHLAWIRIDLQLSCRRGWSTYVDDTFAAPASTAWAMSANAPLHLTLGRRAGRRWFRQTDTLTIAPGPGGLTGSVTVTVRARALKIGQCSATLPAFQLTH
jgi:hypothetical protein